MPKTTESGIGNMKSSPNTITPINSTFSVSKVKGDISKVNFIKNNLIKLYKVSDIKVAIAAPVMSYCFINTKFKNTFNTPRHRRNKRLNL